MAPSLNAMDWPIVNKHDVLRKGTSYALQVPRAAFRAGAKPSDYLSKPPVIVNSLPKSGTHLLLQVARALPEVRYFGSFLAQTPSISLTPRTQQKVDREIDKIVPGEVLGAHLFYTPETEASLNAINALNIFIYRDPRDVLISAANYLANMNPWHRLHKHFAQISDEQARIRLAITGLGIPAYPDVKTRFKNYLGWIESPTAVCVQYETLMGPDQEQELRRVVIAAKDRGLDLDVERALQSVREAIQPEKSHTFSGGGTGKWRTKMSEENLKLFESVTEGAFERCYS